MRVRLVLNEDTSTQQVKAKSDEKDLIKVNTPQQSTRMQPTRRRACHALTRILKALSDATRMAGGHLSGWMSFAMRR